MPCHSSSKHLTDEELIGLKGRRRKRRGMVKSGSGGKTGDMVLPEAMMSKVNKNTKQLKVIVDSLNASQMCGVGRLVKGILNVCHNLHKKQISQLIRDRKFIDAIVKGKGMVSTRKKILSDQRGGFPGILFPLAAQLAASVISQLGKFFRL